MASRVQKTTTKWKEVFHVTPAPSFSPVRLEEVPRDLDWKFLDSQPPIDQSRRHHVFLRQPDEDHLLPGPAEIRALCLKKHQKNMVRVNVNIDDLLKKSIEKEIPDSGCKFQCSAYFGKIAWFIDEEVLRQNLPLTLKSFSRPFQKISKSSGLKEQFYSRAITDAERMLKKLGSVCEVPVPEPEQYLYLQVFSREDETMYRVKVTEERGTGAFHLSAVWTPRTLMSIRGDFICFGRAHDLRIIFRCTTDEISPEIRRNIEDIVNSCTRNKEGKLEMILKTKKVVVGHVFERIVHKFPCNDWSVNYINYTDHFIDKETQPEGVVTPLPPGHDCQDIQVMLQEIDYPGPGKADKIKLNVSNMIDFSLDLVDMAEDCLQI